MNAGRVSELAIFKVLEFCFVVATCTLLFWLIPDLAYVTERDRSFLPNFFGSLFVISIFYFIILFGPISFIFLLFIDRYLLVGCRVALFNALFFFAYANVVTYHFSQESVPTQIIMSALIVTLFIFFFGLWFLRVFRRPRK